MTALGSLSWENVREHYDERVNVHEELLRLHDRGPSDELAQLLVGLSNPAGNYSAAEHRLGPKILGSNSNVNRRLHDLASKFRALTKARTVPQLIRVEALSYLAIGAASRDEHDARGRGRRSSRARGWSGAGRYRLPMGGCDRERALRRASRIGPSLRTSTARGGGRRSSGGGTAGSASRGARAGGRRGRGAGGRVRAAPACARPPPSPAPGEATGRRAPP